MSITLAEVLDENPNNVNLLLGGVSAGEAGAVLLQQHITKTPKLQILELRGSTVGPGGCGRIARALHEHPCIRHVGLARNGLDMPSTIELINAASTCRMLQSLDLEWNAVDDSCASVLSKWLSQLDCSLVALNLERNFITRTGAMQLAQAVTQNTSLQHLNIGHMRCESDAAAAWGSMLGKNSTLLTFNMSGTELLTDGTKHILLGLSKNHSLKALSLQYCQGLTALSEISGEMRFDICLKELNLQGSRAAPNEAAARGFATAIQKATGLLGLNISRCVVSDAAMCQILGGISFVMSLQVFDVSACGMGDESMAPLAQLLDRCINIHTFALDDNHVGTRGAQILSEGIAKAQSLTSLSCAGCDLRNAGVAALAVALRKKHLVTLKISNNSFDIDGGRALVRGLLDDPSYNIMRELDISHNRLTARYAALLGLLFKRHPNLMPVCVRGTSISAAVQEAYVDATSIQTTKETQAAAEIEMEAESNGAAGGGQQQQQQKGGEDFDPHLSLLQQGTDAAVVAKKLSVDFERKRAVQREGQQPLSPQQSTSIFTNFHGATPATRKMPPSVNSAVGDSAKQTIATRKTDGSWLDGEFGDTVNAILNATTNFRTGGIRGWEAELQSTGVVDPESPLRRSVRRADVLHGGAVGSGDVGLSPSSRKSRSSSLSDILGQQTQYRLVDVGAGGGSGSVGTAASSATGVIGGGGGEVGTSPSSSGGVGANATTTTGILSPAAQSAIDSIAGVVKSSKTGDDSSNNNTAAAAVASSAAAKQQQQLTRELQRSRPSAGGFLGLAGLAPRTDPSPMWARRPPLYDMEACIGEELCVSEPQLKLLFMELDSEKQGHISRSDAEVAYQRYCVDYDEARDKKRNDGFFDKYARDGKVSYDAFCMLMLSLVNR